MENVISKTKYLFISLIIVLAFSCSAEDGADGADGADGNANVTSVQINGVSFIDGETSYSVSELTQDILDNGVVISYFRDSGASTWFALPLSLSGFEVFIQSIQLGTITIRANYNASNIDFRFVLIEASNKSAGLTKQGVFNELKAAGIDVNNYNEVMDYYGLDY